ncbi:L-galactonate dehydratase [Glutinoglossum americanum]|uniref:L-galactonate dehydratase n=1 Tax=Glutinoglossum americanum TaxID=1670608 RepID=A0A9P8I4E6_9PEZI|nr:L-galactonate dehydratase [Glutinoglossum americanum]
MTTHEELFDDLQVNFPPSLRDQGWYLTTASSLIATGRPDSIATLYLYLIALPQFSTPDQRKWLSHRLRVVLMKGWTLVGIPVVLGALAALARVEKEEDTEAGLERQNVLDMRHLRDRGTAYLQTLYKGNLDPIFETWGSHSEHFEWLEKDIIYGIFLADFSVLGPVETELVVLPAIMCQGLQRPTGWHLRGIRRLGVSVEDVEALESCVEKIAKWAGKDTEGWVRVKDVEGETFTIGRGNDIVCKAIEALAGRINGKTLESLTANWGQTWRYLVSDSQLRWIGPEKGVIHLALGAVVNAIWDLWAKTLGKPVWRIVAEMSPEEFVRCIDFRYITDAITPDEAIEILKEQEVGKAQRMKNAENSKAVPAYTTSAGWLGYEDEKVKELLKGTLAEGYKHFKMKVGGSVEADRKRLAIAREVIGYGRGNILMVDANQVWSVPEAIEYMHQLKEFKPWFIEEPTSPDDILGHKAIRQALEPLGIGVATGEMCQNRVVFKQLLASGAIDVCQVDACRLGGINEVLAVLLMAKKFGIPIVPHSGGVGLPEYTQHISTIDYVVVSGKISILEYVDHLHEHFHYPAVIKEGFYQTPTEPGYSVEMREESMERFSFPEGEFWKSEVGRGILAGEKI